jgi:predicted RNase H-like nuclease (RuvC/YqgF family)
MRVSKSISCLLVALCATLLSADENPDQDAQSLAEIARREGERRMQLDQLGIEGKVIDGNPEQLAPKGNLTVFTPKSPAHKDTPTSSASPKSKPSIRSLRTKLQKLDREIKKGEDSIEMLRTRLHEARWALPKIGKVKEDNQNVALQRRLREQIEELEIKLKYMREERRENYEMGRKAGYLPGDLEGKGIVP